MSLVQSPSELLRRWLRLFARKPTASREFAAAVPFAFAFLENEYGFVRSPKRSISYETWFEYAKPGVTVVIGFEVGTSPHVALEASASPEPGLRREFGMHELEQEMIKWRGYHRRPSAPSSIAEAVTELANTLRSIGGEVLNGDFTILFDRQRRLVAAVRRNREP